MARHGEKNTDFWFSRIIKKLYAINIRIQTGIRQCSRKPIKPLVCVFWILALGLAFLMTYQCLIPKAYYESSTDAAQTNTFTATFGGDVMLGRYIGKKYCDFGDYDSLFMDLKGYWQNADLNIVNLEGIALQYSSENYTARDKDIHLNCSFSALDALIDSGVNALVCANNHAADYGHEAIADFLNQVEAGSALAIGMGRNIDEASLARFYDADGIRIGIVAINQLYLEGWDGLSDKPTLLTSLDAEECCRIVASAKANCDLLIVYMHWGNENEIRANSEQISTGYSLVDAGADIVVGSHPHVLQKIEKYHGGIIFYSLGNLIMDQGGSFVRDTALINFAIDSLGKATFELVPMRCVNGIPTVTNNGFYKARINRELLQDISPSEIMYNQDGHAVIQTQFSFADTARPDGD